MKTDLAQLWKSLALLFLVVFSPAEGAEKTREQVDALVTPIIQLLVQPASSKKDSALLKLSEDLYQARGEACEAEWYRFLHDLVALRRRIDLESQKMWIQRTNMVDQTISARNALIKEYNQFPSIGNRLPTPQELPPRRKTSLDILVQSLGYAHAGRPTKTFEDDFANFGHWFRSACDSKWIAAIKGGSLASLNKR